MTSTPITRSMVRKATIAAVRQAKAGPNGLRLTPGQVRHIKSGAKGAPSLPGRNVSPAPLHFHSLPGYPFGWPARFHLLRFWRRR